MDKNFGIGAKAYFGDTIAAKPVSTISRIWGSIYLMIRILFMVLVFNSVLTGWSAHWGMLIRKLIGINVN